MWPSFWLMGNLGRPGYQNSTDGMWPYSFNTCVASNPSWYQAFDNKTVRADWKCWNLERSSRTVGEGLLQGSCRKATAR